MQRTMLKSKIHRATHYVGSITIDPELIEAPDMLEFEQVAVVDVNNCKPRVVHLGANNEILSVDDQVASLLGVTDPMAVEDSAAVPVA